MKRRQAEQEKYPGRQPQQAEHLLFEMLTEKRFARLVTHGGPLK
jgi:hypothetical protein